MKKIFYFIGIAILSLSASCSNEEIPPQIPEVKMFRPIVKGAFGDINYTNHQPKTKSGVIEIDSKHNYKTDGERFYWHHGDKVRLYFFNDSIPNSQPVTHTYTAVVENNAKLNYCEFEADGEFEINPGTYTVYALYPADGWQKEDSLYKVSLSESAIIQNSESSEHLGRNMFMKAKAEKVVIGEGNTNSIDLKFKHLGSVIRIHVEKKESIYTTLDKGIMTVRNLNRSVDFYPISAYLNGGIDGDSLIATEWLDSVKINVRNALEYDVFIPILPNGGFNIGDSLVFSGVLSNDNPANSVPLRLSLPILDSLSFLKNGFQPSKSYYFSATKWN